MRDGGHSIPDKTQPPHPLAVRLAAALAPGARVLVLGPGDGRNLPVLRGAGFQVVTVKADAERFDDLGGPVDGVLSTHALLHGTPRTIRSRVARISALLGVPGRFAAAFGSTSDPRYGQGTLVEEDAWAPDEGSEAGVVHAYFDREGLEAMLAPFSSWHLEERDVRGVVGAWAHAPGEAGAPSVHWFAEARRD